MPVGLLDVCEYEQGTVVMRPGDAVLCFSDGISEATNAKGEMWDETDVEKIAQACGGLSAKQMIDRLVEMTDAFAGEAEQADDMTVVAIRTV